MSQTNKNKNHTKDIQLSETDKHLVSKSKLEFKDLLLSSNILKGLDHAGLKTPSPIQLAAIPLGRLGIDIIAQAKSGTGKTLVFTIIALESLNEIGNKPNVIILTPTREIAVQVADVVRRIGIYFDGLACGTFVGGVPLSHDEAILSRRCNIVVGTPGRVKQLIERGALVADKVSLIVLDEADKLLEESFESDIKWICDQCSEKKQTIAFSATYSEKSSNKIAAMMNNPQTIILSGGSPQLLGVRQFKYNVDENCESNDTNDNLNNRLEALSAILEQIPFHQCVVFCHSFGRAQRIEQRLNDDAWPVASIAGGLIQSERLSVMDAFRSGKLKILVSTDLTARGVDVEMTNLIVHFDNTISPATYFHRVGRAGRFGTYGMSVLLYSDSMPSDKQILKILKQKYNIDPTLLSPNDEIPEDFLSGNIELNDTPTIDTSGTATTFDTVSALHTQDKQRLLESGEVVDDDKIDDNDVNNNDDNDVNNNNNNEDISLLSPTSPSSIEYNTDLVSPTSPTSLHSSSNIDVTLNQSSSVSTISLSKQPNLPIPLRSKKRNVNGSSKQKKRLRRSKQQQSTTTTTTKSSSFKDENELFRIKPYQTLNITQWPIGSVCEARYIDGLWYNATVVSRNIGCATVVFSDYPDDEPLQLPLRHLRKKLCERKLIIIRGPSGSGKSTLVRELLSNGGVSLSTDDFFVNDQGKYEFNFENIVEAHDWNKKRAQSSINDGCSPILIDNTNLEAWEAHPYVKMARNAKYHVEIKDSNAPWRSNAIELAKRNKHGVPLEGIENQLKRMTNYSVEDALKATERPSQESLKPSIQEKTTIAQEKNNEIIDESFNIQQTTNQSQSNNVNHTSSQSTNWSQYSPYTASMPMYHNTFNYTQYLPDSPLYVYLNGLSNTPIGL